MIADSGKSLCVKKVDTYPGQFTLFRALQLVQKYKPALGFFTKKIGAVMCFRKVHQPKQETIVSELNYMCSVMCLNPTTIRVASRQLRLVVVHYRIVDCMWNGRVQKLAFFLKAACL